MFSLHYPSFGPPDVFSADYLLTIVMKFPNFSTPHLKDASVLKFPGQEEGIHIFPNFVKNIQTPIPINVDFPPCKSKKEARPHDVSHNALVAVVVDDDLHQLSHGGHQVFKMLQELGDFQTGTCSLTANRKGTVRTEMQTGSQLSIGVKNQIMVILIIAPHFYAACSLARCAAQRDGHKCINTSNGQNEMVLGYTTTNPWKDLHTAILGLTENYATK